MSSEDAFAHLENTARKCPMLSNGQPGSRAIWPYKESGDTWEAKDFEAAEAFAANEEPHSDEDDSSV